ncbi:MAG: hypothetical protein AAF438_01815 [Pseudomonadota bacterium]
MSKQDLRSTAGWGFELSMAWILISVVALGFVLNAILLPQKIPPFSPLLAFHGVAMIAWFLFLPLQVSAVRAGANRRHAVLGKASVVLVVAIIVSGLSIALVRYHRLFAENDAAVVLLFNVGNMLSFTVLYVLALSYRRQLDFHRRYMVLATICLTPPAVARIVDSLDLSPALALLILLSLFLCIPLRDVSCLGKVHKGTIVGGSIFFGVLLASLIVGGTNWWESFILDFFTLPKG